MGKVPALEDGAVRMWDSGAICTYLADQYPTAKLAPPIGSPDRGAYLMWIMYTNSVIEPAMGERMGGLKPNPVTYGWGSWEQMLETLRTAVGHSTWILGERFCAADVLLGMSATSCVSQMLTDEPVLFAYADAAPRGPRFKSVCVGVRPEADYISPAESSASSQ